MGFLGSIFGSKVKVPKFERIDLDATLQDSLDSILSTIPEADRIASRITEAETDIAMNTLERFNPGSLALLKQLTDSVSEGLTGQLPKDVADLVENQAAARAFMQGRSGSEAADNLTLRDFGLTSLSRIDRSQQQAQAVLSLVNNMAPRPTSLSNFFLSPGQRLSFLQSERDAEFNRDLSAAQAKAAPNPVAAAFGNTILSAAGTALGGGLFSLGSSLLSGASQTAAPPVSVSPTGEISQSAFNFGYKT